MSVNPTTTTMEADRVTDPQNLDRLEQWAQKVVEESARLPADISESELLEREAGWYAEYFAPEDGWLVASPDDPAMRAWLLEEEGMSPELADAVLAEMSRLAAER
jgi:hypothetical protein